MKSLLPSFIIDLYKYPKRTFYDMTLVLVISPALFTVVSQHFNLSLQMLLERVVSVCVQSCSDWISI
jgi:hypothetical protein